MRELRYLGSSLDCLVLDYFVHRELEVNFGVQVLAFLVYALVLTLAHRVALVNDILNFDGRQLCNCLIQCFVSGLGSF